MVAAAIIGGAAVGAAGSAYAGSKAAKATKNASDASLQAQREALAQQEQMSRPYRGLGESAIPQLQSLLGLSPVTPAGTPTPNVSTPRVPSRGGGPLSKGIYDLLTQPGGAWAPTAGGGVQPIMSTGLQDPSQSQSMDPLATLRATPGYQFALEQGLQGATNAATAQGMSLSGNTLQALDRYGTGLADQTYGEQIARLMGVANLGQAAAAGQAANIGAAANNIGSTLINQGNTMAGINANTIAGITKAIGSGIDQYGQSQTLAGLTNPSFADYAGMSDAYIGSNIGYPAPIMGEP